MKKNVIIIVIDGGRVDFTKKSKIYENIKLRSIFFPNSITYAPYTTAAMHAILTGTYGNRNGVNSYWNVNKFKNNKFKTLAGYLSSLGYRTFADGHTELIIPKFGFDEFTIHDEQTVNLIKHHSKLLDKMNTLNEKDENFFLYLHYSKIHTGISNEVLKVYNNFSKEFFANRELNFKRYDKLFSDSEIYLESIFKKIFELKFDKNSIILVISDHGIGLGEKFGERAYGAFCYDYTLKTFAYLLNSDFQAQEIDTNVRHVDYMPTILEMLDVETDHSFQKIDGVSLLPLIMGQNFQENFAFSETGNPLMDSKPPKIPNTKSIRTSKWKLILNEYDDSKEFYDLENDPNEEENLIGNNDELENKFMSELSKYVNSSSD
jgi:arylsulfatase A-like enzyme